MLRNKTFYIILLILFSVILCANGILAIASVPTAEGQIRNFDAQNLPENDDFGGTDAPGENPSPVPALPEENPSGGFAMPLRSIQLPILLICVLGIAFSIFMIVRISKKQKSVPAAKAQEPTETAQQKEKPNEGAHLKNRKKRILALCIVAVFVAVVAILPTILGGRAASGAAVKEEVIAATAEKGNLSANFLSGGVLSNDDAISVEIPADVEIEEYAVENGDFVEEGDLIATVDSASVMQAISEMQQAMDALDERLEAAAKDTVTTKITMPSAGRVKKIFAAVGDDVVDVMYQNGALMLLSLDGMMAVEIQTDTLSISDHVTVTLANGTEEDGRVSTLSENTATVTLSDETAVYGEQVTVTDENGKTLGTGALSCNSELKITGYAGTVSKLSAKENEKLSAGKHLMTLEEESNSANYTALYEERKELEDRMAELFTIYEKGGVYAQYSGEITDIPEDDAEEDTSETVSAEQMMQMQMSGISAIQPRLASAEETTQPTEPNPEGSTSGEEGEKPPQTTPRYTGRYAALLTKVSYGALEVRLSAEPVAITSPREVAQIAAQLTIPAQLSPTDTTDVLTETENGLQQASLADLQAGDWLLCEFDENGALMKILCQHAEQTSVETPQLPGQMTQFPAGSYLPNFGSSMSAMQQQETPQEYELTKTDVCAIIPEEYMTISISVDELDILKLEIGQTAVIQPDSMGGQHFEGEVIEIDRTGVNQGGNTKYTVQLKLPRANGMLSGMNASVTIPLEAHNDILTVPTEALYEENGKTYLYTGYHKKQDTLTDPVEVTTGYSDGDQTEITSGLTPGATYYYRYADTISYSFG